MHLRPTLLLLPLLSTYVASTTATVTVTMTAPAPCFTPIGSEYYLKTQVIEGGNSSKSGLYLEGYHTGAGENDAVLVPNTSDHTLAKGWLDGSYQQLDLGSYFPWSFTMGTDTNDAGFESVYINAGVGQAGFSFNGSRLQWSSAVAFGVSGGGNEFLGWIVCDWVHGLPQLFWLSTTGAVSSPSNCARVELHQELVRK